MDDEIDYGAVIFVKGKHEGSLGYYDNDEPGDDGKDKAVVYLWAPFQSEYIFVDYDYIRPIASLEHERFKKENPAICQLMGIF